MDLGRYLRQTSLSNFGIERQIKLYQSKVLVVGLGGLGTPIVQYLNAMGVGTLGLVEFDIIELHNLQRQVIYKENDLGKKKIDVVTNYLSNQNTNTKIIPFKTYLNSKNALKIFEKFDLIIDATDNFSTRYLINDSCIILKKPFIYGAIHGFEGHLSVFNYKNGPTYRCIFPEMPKINEVPNCDENGVLGIIPGIVGCNQAIEAIKIITDLGDVMSGILWIYDGLKQNIQKIKINSNPKNKNIDKLKDNYDQIFCETKNTISCEDFIKIQSDKNHLIIDVRAKKEFENYSIKNSLNIPLEKIRRINKSLLNKNEIYIVCKTGKRSLIALDIIKENYPNARLKNILGGIDKYKSLCH